MSNCFLSPVLSNTTKYEDRKFKKSEYCEKPDVKTRSPCKEGFSSFPSLRPALKTFFRGPENELLQIWVCHFRAEKRSAQASAHLLSQAQGGLFCALTEFDCVCLNEMHEV